MLCKKMGKCVIREIQRTSKTYLSGAFNKLLNEGDV